MNEAMTIGEVAKRSGVATSALRYYEDQGPDSLSTDRFRTPALPASRDPARRVHRVRTENRALARGSAAELAKLPKNHVPNDPTGRSCRDAGRPAFASVSRELERLEAGLTECIGCGLSVARSVSVRQPGRSSRSARSGAAILDCVAWHQSWRSLLCLPAMYVRREEAEATIASTNVRLILVLAALFARSCSARCITPCRANSGAQPFA
jgi:MerR family redox-sensitive transcriptional activator SoxR